MKTGLIALFATIATVGLVGCKKEPSAADAPAADVPIALDKAMLGVFAPLPEVMDSPDNPLTEAKIQLGRMLYYDTRLSKSGAISCNSCHLLGDSFGAEPRPTSVGHGEQVGTRNSPSVYNAAGHFRQFWDGRAADVEEQAKGPILNPIEMGMGSEDEVLSVLRAIPGYMEAFEKAFAGAEQPVTYDNLGKAIGAFERKLVTPGRWDAFLAGKDEALTSVEKKGLTTFVQSGCITCHTGPYLGGHMYQKLGLVEPWPVQSDLGRFEATGDEADKMMFKVSALRNVAKTGPYFHDGGVADLGEAVKMMAKHQLGRTIEQAQVDEIVAFLGALTGEIPTDYITQPDLPEGGKPLGGK